MTNTTVRDVPAPARGLTRGLLLLMSVATGLSVAGNYFAQPLLDLFRHELNLGPAMAVLIVTAAQVGYALGLLLLVPLGDLRERRGLAVGLFGATAVFLMVSAAAVNPLMLFVGTALTALTSVAAQVIVPFAVTLAAPAERGRVIGTVMSGLLVGSLLARTASGGLAELGGWRTVYWVNALLMALVALLLWRRLPTLYTPVALSYPALLRSTASLLRTEPVLRRRAAMGALGLGSFNMFWTAVTFLLAGRYGWGEAAIGLLGLIGIAGAVATPYAGRLADRGHVQRLTGLAAAGLTVAWLPLLLGSRSLAWLIVGAVALNVAQSVLLNANQNVIYALNPDIRNRLNSAFMTSFFVGGAAGSALTAALWPRWGWPGITLIGATLAAATFTLWLTDRRPPRPNAK
ncbi:MFS transporter [Actinomadura flavalba]|uniref:MFS transporter n=1 Tax=Actinomadura flavalba TaxID=1120938 RepID=UPI0006858519|nr:MFS transporter [Actinomadura flavalba]